MRNSSNKVYIERIEKLRYEVVSTYNVVIETRIGQIDEISTFRNRVKGRRCKEKAENKNKGKIFGKIHVRLIAAAFLEEKLEKKRSQESIPHSPSNWQLSCIQFGLESTDIGFESCNRHGIFQLR